MKTLPLSVSLFFGNAQARWHMGKCPKITRESLGELMPHDLTTRSFEGDWFV